MSDQVRTGSSTPPKVHAKMRPDSSVEACPAAHFKVLAGQVLAAHHSVVLVPASVPRVRKWFDFVSPDRQVVGIAHYFTNLRSVMQPPTKFPIISEDVWLLDKTGAATPFIVFGNDVRFRFDGSPGTAN